MADQEPGNNEIRLKEALDRKKEEVDTKISIPIPAMAAEQVTESVRIREAEPVACETVDTPIVAADTSIEQSLVAESEQDMAVDEPINDGVVGEVAIAEKVSSELVIVANVTDIVEAEVPEKRCSFVECSSDDVHSKECVSEVVQTKPEEVTAPIMTVPESETPQEAASTEIDDATSKLGSEPHLSSAPDNAEDSGVSVVSDKIDEPVTEKPRLADPVEKCTESNDVAPSLDDVEKMETEPAIEAGGKVSVPATSVSGKKETPEKTKIEKRKPEKLDFGKLELAVSQPQVKIMRSPEVEGAVKNLQQMENREHRAPILNVPIVKPREETGEKRRASSPADSPTKKSRSAGLDSVVNRLKERQTDPVFVLPVLSPDAPDSPAGSPTKSPKSPPAQRRTPPKAVLDEYAKIPSLSVKISPTATVPKQLSPKGRSPPQQRSPPPQRSPFKSPMSPVRAALPTAQLTVVPRVASPSGDSPLGSPAKIVSPPKLTPTIQTEPASDTDTHVISFKEHIDALVTKELISGQENADNDEKMDDTETADSNDKPNKSHRRRPKYMHRRRGKARKDAPPKPSVIKLDNADDNAVDIPDPESADAPPTTTTTTTTTGADDNPDDDTSQDASRSKSKSRQPKTPRKTASCSTLEDLGKTQDDMGNAIFLADNVHEYQWPQDEKEGEWSVIQEQISEYLGIKSFKRKYPNLIRRSIVMQERNYLQEKGVVTETQCDLGLTALQTEEVLDLMAQDYPTKYKEFTTVLKDRQRQRLLEKRKAAEMLMTDKTKLAELRKKAIKSTFEFNASFMRERREERRAYLDMQTMEVHFPRGRMKTLAPDCTKVGAYPVALIPGQFQEYYKRYTPDEMKYLPLNTATYPAPKHLLSVYADPNQGPEVDTDSDDNMSSSSSDSESQAAPSPAPMETNDSESAVDKASLSSGPVKVKACKVCQETEESKTEIDEEVLTCSECGAAGHPTCLELTEAMVKLCRSYPWQCMECKTCVECMDPYDEDKMMFCDRCDRGYHTFCLGVKSIPTGRWECPSCKPRDTPKTTPQKKRGRKKRTSETPTTAE